MLGTEDPVQSQVGPGSWLVNFNYCAFLHLTSLLLPLKRETEIKKELLIILDFTQ